MSVIRINAITVPAEGGDELARRFATRAGAVDQAEGFEGFELLRPTDTRTTWLVVTRWRDEESFQAWVSSPAFMHGHRGLAGGSGAGAHPHGAAAGGSGAGAHPHAHGGPAGGDGEHTPVSGAAPLATSSELWSYEVVDLGAAAG